MAGKDSTRKAREQKRPQDRPKQGGAKGAGASQGKAKGKVGSSADAARAFGGEIDFGTPTDEAIRDEGAPGREPTLGGDRSTGGGPTGVRTAGVGMGGRGPAGSGSGGDADTDFIGVGTEGGGSVSQSGKLDATPGPDDSDGSSNEFASGPPARGENTAPRGTIGGGGPTTGINYDRDADNAGGGGYGGGAAGGKVAPDGNVAGMTDSQFAEAEQRRQERTGTRGKTVPAKGASQASEPAAEGAPSPRAVGGDRPSRTKRRP